MADRAIPADRQRKIGVGVHNAQVLDVGSMADADGFDIAPQHCAKPDGHILSEADVTDHISIWRNPKSADRGQIGYDIIVCVNGQFDSLRLARR